MDLSAATGRRLGRLRADLDARGLEGILVSQPESRYYLSGYTGHDLPPRDSAGYLLVTPTRALLLTDPRTTEQAASEAPDFEVVAYETGVRAPRAIVETARKLGLRRLAFEPIHLPYATWKAVQDEGDVELIETDPLVDHLRVVKDELELQQLRAAIDVLDECFAHVCRWIQPGVTEKRVAREVELYLLEHADGTSFPSIVASGPNGSMPHAVPSDRVIREGEGITIDIGARANGYCSDMTRTICLGEPAEAKLHEVWDLVLEAQQQAERRVRPGMTGIEADALARDVIAAADLGGRFTHSTGHGIGLEVHEPPWVSAVRGAEPLHAGMVFSVEPGVYLPGWGGVRIEDLVLLADDGARVLSRSPKTLVVGR
jgi:Xaa-Pro aminopeptidase